MNEPFPPCACCVAQILAKCWEVCVCSAGGEEKSPTLSGFRGVVERGFKKIKKQSGENLFPTPWAPPVVRPLWEGLGDFSKPFYRPIVICSGDLHFVLVY